tara:strand:- start:93 stop:2033 length:1941 start_codon:yes stop_codon:yes gene_type:complete
MSETINFQPIKYGQFLSDKTFIVPDYQRGYDWSPEHLNDLWEDLHYHLNKYNEGIPETFYLGTVIIKTPEKIHHHHEIVDGQQRFTTLYILAIALKNEFKNRSNQIDDSFNQSVMRIDTLILNKYSAGSKQEYMNPRLIASNGEPKPIRDILELISRKDWNGVFPTKDNSIFKKDKKIHGSTANSRIKLLKTAYDFHMEEIQSLDDDNLFNLFDVVSNITLIAAVVKEDDQAFYLFETTNARGKDLEVSDLLKNHFFRKIQGDNIDVLEQWNQVVTNAGNSKLITMLKHFHYVYDSHVQKKALYKSLQKLADNGSIGSVEGLLNELEKYSEFHNIMHSGQMNNFIQYIQERNVKCPTEEKQEQYYLSICALRLFRAEVTYPIIYAFFEKFSEHYIDDKSYSIQALTFLKALEKFHFVNYKICMDKGNIIEKPYAEFAGKIFKTKNAKEFMVVIGDFYDFLRDKFMTESRFTEKFIELSYGDKEDIRYIFHKIEDHYINGSRQRYKFFDPDKTDNTNVKTFNESIEHFWPVTFKAGQHITEDDFEKYKSNDDDIGGLRDNIGNLLVMDPRINDKLKNKIPVKKREILLNNQNHLPKYITEFIHDDLDNWNPESINQRANEISELCYQKIFNISDTEPKITKQQLDKF